MDLIAVSSKYLTKGSIIENLGSKHEFLPER